MSFAPFIQNKSNFDNFKSKDKKKLRSEENKKFFCGESPGFWQYEKKWDVTDAESNLITPGIGTRQKTEVALVGELHPNNYELPVANISQKEQDEKFYYPAYYTGPGNGFGNLNVSSSIRIGDFTRTETKNYKAQKECEVLERWDFIDDRWTKPENLVMDIPRGGDTTRKPEINLSVESRLEESREFAFRY
jgi:hypothetical protein